MNEAEKELVQQILDSVGSVAVLRHKYDKLLSDLCKVVEDMGREQDRLIADESSAGLESKIRAAEIYQWANKLESLLNGVCDG